MRGLLVAFALLLLAGNALGQGITNPGVVGPGSAVSGNVVTFSGISGKIIVDGGVALSALAPLANPTFTTKILITGGGTPVAGAGTAVVSYDSTYGTWISGNGGTYDLTLGNKSGAAVAVVPTGTTSVLFQGSITAPSPTFTGTVTLPGQIVAIRVVTAAGAVTIASGDYVVVVNKTVGAATTANLPAGVTGAVYIVKDGKGDATTNPITITPAAGTIDGSATYVMSTNYGSVNLVYNGTQWNVF